MALSHDNSRLEQQWTYMQACELSPASNFLFADDHRKPLAGAIR
jgi:hypothetical protein